MKTSHKKYLAKVNGKFLLKDFKTSYHGKLGKAEGKARLEKVKLEMNSYQELLYASGTHSLLLIFQAMDAAGKDSAIKHIMTGLNPQGCQVWNFKTPNTEEYEHDFLWRHYKALPERGRVGIHNRSHYENVLVCKVHPAYVLTERVPGYDDVKKLDQKFWDRRYESIKNFEKHLSENGTTIIKFFLHVGKDEQKQRFLDRINEPAKNWKFAVGDLKERALWKEYQKAYEEAIGNTSTATAPWYIIPADKKWYARLVISEVITETLKGMGLKFPVLPKEELEELQTIKQALLNDTNSQ